MLNSKELYYDAGFRAGKARTQSDESRAQFETRWFNEARALESKCDKQNATDEFNRGYKDGRGMLYRG